MPPPDAAEYHNAYCKSRNAALPSPSDAAIVCHWLFGDEIEDGFQPEPRDGRGAVTATPWTLVADADGGGSGGDGEAGIPPPYSVLLDKENLLA